MQVIYLKTLYIYVIFKFSRLQDEVSDLKQKLSDEKKERNEKHISYRNEIAHFKTENEELRRQVERVYL